MIVGGGVAGLEAVLALHDLADPQVSVTLIAPEAVFTPRALDLARPYTGGPADQLDLERFMAEHGGRFRRTAVLGVDAEQRTLSCTTGPDERYDTLVIAVGASARPAYEHALTFGADFPACDELLADLAHGGPHSVAFVVPPDCTWPLPLYELALMTADEARLTSADEIRVHLVTPERRALDLFGARASAAVTELLQAAHIGLHCGIDADVQRGGHVGLGPEGTLAVDRVVALARLDGPRLAGLPADARGFIPVDEYGRVAGVDAVYAAGDATDHPIKHGGLASQQADASLPMSQPPRAHRSSPCRTARCSAGGCSPGFARHASALVAAGEGLRPLPRAVPRGARTRGTSAAPERTGRHNRRPAAS